MSLRMKKTAVNIDDQQKQQQHQLRSEQTTRKEALLQKLNNMNSNLNASINSKNQNLIGKSAPKPNVTFSPSQTLSNNNRHAKLDENEPIEILIDDDEPHTIERQTLPSFYCVNINQDGLPNMDRASHFNADEIEPKTLEFKLRPISGIRNHIKRNLTMSMSNSSTTLSSNSNVGSTMDICRQTDIVSRLSSVKTLRRLDMSFNNMQTYPRRLCELKMLESLNLSGNLLQDTDMPVEMETYQFLVELILDSNRLKRIPKAICKCKKLSRLSLSHNMLSDLKQVEFVKRLRFLVADHNAITQLDENLKQLDRLEFLYLNNNVIQQIHSNLFKASLNTLRHLDLSYNKLQTVQAEMFMLPNLEVLNLSNNQLTRLPLMSTTYFRTQPIYSIDLSCNQLVRFYDYLITLAQNVDLSANKIKTIPSKMLLKLPYETIDDKHVKLDENPLVDPPIELCKYGLSVLKQYFDEINKDVQVNRGFKLAILGESKSGKTSVAYALEDLCTNSNLIEQLGAVGEHEAAVESKFVDIHEFRLNNNDEDNDEDNKNEDASEYQDEYQELASSRAKSVRSEKTKTNSKPAKKNSKSRISSSLAQQNVELTTSKNVAQPPTKATKTCMPVTIYDFNGSIQQYGHLFDVFIDKHSLILLCVDATVYLSMNRERIRKYEMYLRNLLDILFLKMSKTIKFFIVPVLTKVDQIPTNGAQQGLDRKSLVERVNFLIQNQLERKLNDIKSELNKFEQQTQISASQSERLKQLVQTQSNLSPFIHKQCVAFSAKSMFGVRTLLETVKQVILDNSKHFPDVNKKVPTFWLEVENHACNVLSEMPTTRYVDDRLRIQYKNNNMESESNTSILYLGYETFKESVIEKYGMKHLIEQITKYMNSSGKIIWFYERNKLKEKVFLRPNVLFDMFFVLFRLNFDENFADTHTQALRAKLMRTTFNKEYSSRLIEDYVQRGRLHIDLLKMLWYPILITDNVQLLVEVLLMFVTNFYLGYPDLSKDKCKLLFQMYSLNAQANKSVNESQTQSKGANKSQLSYYSIANASTANSSMSNQHSIPNATQAQQNSTTKMNLPPFSSLTIPSYLPVLDEQEIFIDELKRQLESECSNAMHLAVKQGLKTKAHRLLSKISQKYSFTWGLLPGVFHRFATSAMINSDFYYKSHFRNFIQAHNEENTIW
jgi:Leucine-rich repeat (LRR) protein